MPFNRPYTAEMSFGLQQGDPDEISPLHPVITEILIRDNKTQECVAQRAARGHENQLLSFVLGKRFRIVYTDAATDVWYGSTQTSRELYLPIWRWQRWLLNWRLPRATD